MTGFVVDASLIVATLVREADTDVARRVMGDVQVVGAVAPPHLSFEVANALTMKLRRKLIDVSYRDEALDTFLAYEIGLDSPADHGAVARRIVSFADLHGLTVYDAAYLELALRANLTLATLDGALSKAAVREGLAVRPE